MQKSQITFAPVSFYTLRKQKRPPDQFNEEPPPVLTKGSETEFDNCEEPPPPLLEAETATSDGVKNDFYAHNQNCSVAQSGRVLSLTTASTATGNKAKNGCGTDESGRPAEPFILESRHLPSWIRNCPKCSTNQNCVLFRGRIAGAPQSGLIVSIECALCATTIYNSGYCWEGSEMAEVVEGQTIRADFVCNSTDNGLKPSTSSNAIGSETAAERVQKSGELSKKEVDFNQNYSHQFGLSFPVMFKTQNGQHSGHCERITFRGFVYCHISRQVKTRGGLDSVSYWRCQQQIGPLSSNCSGLVRLEGQNLTCVKAHKHPPDYAATRAILSHVHGEYTRLYLVSGRKGRTRNSLPESATRGPTSAPIILRPIGDRGTLRTITSETERRTDNATDEPTTMETEELIRAITARKERLTVKVSPST